MGNPDELALVVKALQSGLGGCVEWHHESVDRVRQDSDLLVHGLTPERIKALVINYAQMAACPNR